MRGSGFVKAGLPLVLGAVGLVAAEARAEPAGQVASFQASRARTEIVLGTTGIGAESVQSSLVGLLSAELRRMQLSLVERQPKATLSAWAAEATRSPRVLAAILLDGGSEQGWRVIVIDAARGRAIARTLPGGIQKDAASIEAVVSIVVSAAGALREGLEVASSPMEAVVGRPPAPPPDVSDTGPADSSVPVTRPTGHTRSFVRGTLGASVASFSPAAPATEGMTFALGASFRGHVEAHAFGSFFWPARMRGPLGEFRVTRVLFGAALGPVFTAGALSFVPEAGVVGERLHRFDTTPAAGSFATAPSPFVRFGGLLALRLRQRLVRPLSVELVAGSAYFGRRVRFTGSSSESSWSVDAWPAVAFAQLGLDLALD